MKLIPKKNDGMTIEYDFFVSGEVVGYSIIKLTASIEDESMKGFENHVYYEIYEDYRGKGYGQDLLDFTIIQANLLGINPVILICDAANTASRRIIEKHGRHVAEKTNSKGQVFYKFLI